MAVVGRFNSFHSASTAVYKQTPVSTGSAAVPVATQTLTTACWMECYQDGATDKSYILIEPANIAITTPDLV